MDGHPAIRVLIVDAQALTRGGLCYYLQAEEDITVVGEAVSGPQALDLIDTLQPDVALVHMVESDLEGLAITQQFRQRSPRTHVLALGSDADARVVERALRAGAIGYLQAEMGSAELAPAIRQAHAGQAVLAPALAQALMTTDDQPPKLGANLSAREREVLRLMASGRSNEHIAAQLEISRNTVRHHVHNILAKLGAVNRTEAVGMAILHRLVS